MFKNMFNIVLNNFSTFSAIFQTRTHQMFNICLNILHQRCNYMNSSFNVVALRCNSICLWRQSIYSTRNLNGSGLKHSSRDPQNLQKCYYFFSFCFFNVELLFFLFCAPLVIRQVYPQLFLIISGGQKNNIFSTFSQH